MGQCRKNCSGAEAETWVDAVEVWIEMDKFDLFIESLLERLDYSLKIAPNLK